MDLTRPILETILYCKIQPFALRLSPKISRSAAPVTKSHPPTSPNTAPATQNECHQWSAAHMKPHFQCVEQVKSPSNLSKYCALPRKMNVINDLRHTWNLISNAWSKSSHPSKSANTAPATQNECHQWSASHMKPHFQCVEQVKSPSNLTKYCPCHEILTLKMSADTPWMLPPIERRFEDNPRISEDIRG